MSPIIDLPLEFASQSPSIEGGEIEIGVGGGYVSIIIIVSVGICLFVAIFIGRRCSCKDMHNENNRNNNEGHHHLDYIFEYDDNYSDGKNNIDIDEVVIQIDQFIEEERKNARYRDGNDSSEITMEGIKRNDYKVKYEDDDDEDDDDEDDDDDVEVAGDDEDIEKGKVDKTRQESGNTWYSSMVSSLSTLFVKKRSSERDSGSENK